MKTDASLRYHSLGRPGKIEVVSTKPIASQLDLSLAYTPGVAAPALEIAADARKVANYTARQNLVAVVTNGTAVLGLGSHKGRPKVAFRWSRRRGNARKADTAWRGTGGEFEILESSHKARQIGCVG